MRKNLLRNVAMVNCLLMAWPSVAYAAESVADPVDVYALEEVAVTATPLEKYLVTTSVITDKDIEAKGAKTLAEALENVPGLHLHRGKKGDNTLDIRGMGSTYAKIYIDGVLVNPLTKISGQDLDLDMFPVENIEKIEVIKGPAPVAYGTDAIGGMVLITTKNGMNYQGGKVSLSGGSHDTLNGSVAYGGGDDKFNYYINAGMEHTDGFMSNADRKSNHFDTKLKWRIKDDAYLTFSGGYSITDKGCLHAVDPLDGHTISSTKGFWPGLNAWEFRDWEKSNLSLDYKEKVNEQLDYDLKIYRFTERNDLWADGRKYDTNVTPKGYSTSRWNASYWKSTMDGLEFQSNVKLNARNTLTFGSLYNDIDWDKSSANNSDPYNYTWEDYKNKRYGYYVQDTILPDERTTVTLGIRHDKNDVENKDGQRRDDSATNPTVNVVYQLDQRNTLRAAYGETWSFPTMSQLFSSQYGNPDLEPEKAKNYELGLKHCFDEKLTGDIAVFKNNIDDMIVRSNSTQKMVNINHAKVRGIETELNKQFSDRCSGFVNFTYLDTSSLRDDGVTVSDMKYVPHRNFSYGLNYRADKGYRFNLTGHYVSSRETWDDGTNDTRSTLNGVKPVYDEVGSYHVIDVQVKRQVDEALDWYVTVTNLFDEQYWDELFYPGEGRCVILGADFKF